MQKGVMKKETNDTVDIVVITLPENKYHVFVEWLFKIAVALIFMVGLWRVFYVTLIL
jgi:hypothetical protein